MPTSQKSRIKVGLIQNPGQMGNALAHVLSQEGGREVVLGQAWIAAPGRLITCGHVVERYVSAPGALFVRFPASGNKYKLTRITLHPSFVRQPDQLVKFDVALLEVVLQPPESSAKPLPFSYEQSITINQTLWAIRYPAHLGQLSAAPQPLTQEGRYLGPLRTHDTFHLLHDLPLSPGDSGAPISDGDTIVALHCGDTATLPGLNLATTSIRLALWVDALRELGISETAASGGQAASSPFRLVMAFVLSAALVGAIGYFYLASQASKVWSYHPPKLKPIEVAFNHPRNAYKNGEEVEITVTPSAEYYVNLFGVDDSGSGQVVLLYPQHGQKNLVHRGQPCLISQLGTTKLTATPEKCSCFLLAIRADSERAEDLHNKVVLASDQPPNPKEGTPFIITGKELEKRFRTLQDENPEDVLFVRFAGVSSAVGEGK